MGSRQSFEEKVQRIVESVKKHLATDIGITLQEANSSQVFYAFSKAVRDRVMSNWIAAREKMAQDCAKTVYYVSAEYMIGRALGNNLVNMNMLPVAKAAMERLELNINEIECSEPDPGLGNGGLGRLAACFLDSLATMKMPAMGYGLRYHYGIFRQQIRDGYQWEGPDGWLGSGYPWEIRRPNRELDVKFGGRLVGRRRDDGTTLEELVGYDKVRAVPYDVPIVGYDSEGANFVSTLRLWSAADDPQNFLLHFYNEGDWGRALENLSITNVLYPKDNHEKGKWLRLKQEYFLVSATVQDILRRFKLTKKPLAELHENVTVHINDTHPALAVAELQLLLTEQEGLDWNKAWEITRQSCAYTNHTILAEALEKWDVRMFRTLLPRQYRVIEKINQMYCDSIRRRHQHDEPRVRRMSIIEDGLVHMARLAIAGSYSVNGVAALHTSILRERELKDFSDFWPEKFRNITNGVTPRRWLLKCNPELSSFITERIGDGWISDFRQIEKIADFADDKKSINEFLAIKRNNKVRLAEWIKENNPLRDHDGMPMATIDISPDSIFDVQVKRLHEYKRQLMNGLQILMTYHELKENPEANRVPRTYIFGAKAPTGYLMARNIIKFINCVARLVNEDDDVNDKLRVVYLENYNVSLAELVFPASDLSEQISTASQEASGTGNMKFSINGALTIGTDDGANVEMRQAIGDDYWPFLFGLSSDEAIPLMRGKHNPIEELQKSPPSVVRVVEQLNDGSLARDAREQEALEIIYQSLTYGWEGDYADRFLVLKDLLDYHETQKKVDAIYRDKDKWASLCIRNMAGMGTFSSDVSIENYCKHVWNIKPVDLHVGKIQACARNLGLDDSIYTLD